ncbi:kinase-like protein [Canariomyces notabilis]|uniref:mitogen-activated protein kinase n=1 Tax=Canariomyces notabilis TaxID=2074819 RepID=A0AAN6QE37_9PEZI|nr:kinase-like protein [Canariomyces arenarius]
MAPKINKIGDLMLAEVFDLGGENFLYTEFHYIDEDDVVYHGQLKMDKLKISLEQFKSALQRIPDEELYAQLPLDANYTLASDDADENTFYFKRPNIFHYDRYKENDSLDSFPIMMLEEIKALELVSQHPHPNIVKYHGCRVRRGRITAIVLDKHPQSLRDIADDNALGTLDREAFMAALESAVKHLHSLGLAHNDINPRNILVDANGMPVLADFGSCNRIGEKLGLSRGTRGWIEGDMKDYTTSEARHDTFAVEKIRAWLENPDPPRS